MVFVAKGGTGLQFCVQDMTRSQKVKPSAFLAFRLAHQKTHVQASMLVLILFTNMDPSSNTTLASK